MHRDRDDQWVSLPILLTSEHTALIMKTLCDRFDSSMMNGLQAVPTWDACMFTEFGP